MKWALFTKRYKYKQVNNNLNVMINNHNLDRYVPSDIQREIRKNSYFGCVRCGASFCDIDHVDPEFKDALEHDPKRMTLLCKSCHGKKGSAYSVEVLKEAMKNPYCKAHKYVSDELVFSGKPVKIQFGKSLFINPKSLISIDGTSIFSIIPPDDLDPCNRFQISAIFQNINGVDVFRIENNTWFSSTENWDFETIGKRIILRSGKKLITLLIENIPDDRFIIHTVNMFYKGYDIQADNKGVRIITPSNNELLRLDSEGEFEGDIVLNIVNESIDISSLIIKNSNIKISNGSITNNLIIDGSITIGK